MSDDDGDDRESVSTTEADRPSDGELARARGRIIRVCREVLGDLHYEWSNIEERVGADDVATHEARF